MSLDDVVLSVQHAIDRLIRRFRRGGPPEVTHRRFLIVQIDGLSRAVLEQGLASGHVPFLKQLLRRHGYRLEAMAVGLPTSTPAFQMAAMYGMRPDIPGFHYFDRELQSDIHFPRRGHAALVEAKHTDGRRGILQGGSAYAASLPEAPTTVSLPSRLSPARAAAACSRRSRPLWCLAGCV